MTVAALPAKAPRHTPSRMPDATTAGLRRRGRREVSLHSLLLVLFRLTTHRVRRGACYWPGQLCRSIWVGSAAVLRYRPNPDSSVTTSRVLFREAGVAVQDARLY